jgi:protein-tyrosine kinase
MSRIHEIVKPNDKPLSEIASRKSSEEREAMIDLSQLLIENSSEAHSEFSCLYRNLLILGGGKVRTVMVCSAEEGEGTTTVAMNLAALMAREEGLSTLLVEANCTSPTLFEYDGGRPCEGLYEMLLEQGPIERYVVRTSMPQLTVMEVGRPAGVTKSAFTSSRLESVVAECKLHYPLVVFDAAPINSNPESLELAKHVDGVVLVVKSEALTESVQRMKGSLDRVRAKILGVVLNRQKMETPSPSDKV